MLGERMVEIGLPQPSDENLENADWYWGDITRLVLVQIYFPVSRFF